MTAPVSTPGRPAPDRPASLDARPTAAAGRLGPRLLRVAAVLAVLVGVVLRIVWTGPLWLDETLSVDISRLPLGQLFAALRRDGSPPLYYLMLHGWIALFGTSTAAVRALSSVLSILSLPVAYLAGREVGRSLRGPAAGRRVGLTLLLLLAANPYAIRYATETRMYTLELLLVLAGVVLLPRAVRAPTPARLAPVTGLTALLAYSHYWALFLLATVAVGLAVRRHWRPLVAMAVAALFYLPWLPDFLFQLAHTGTPWASPAEPGALVSTVLQWAGPGSVGLLLGIGTVLLAALGLTARRVLGGPLELDLHGRPGARLLAGLYAGPLLLAVLCSVLVSSGFAIRYTAIVLPFWLLLVTLGVLVLPSRRSQAGVLAVVVLAGAWAGWQSIRPARTEAGVIAKVLRADANPGDAVGYCPDQLAPAVHRLLPASAGLHELSFADPTGPALVDWVDYKQRMAAADPALFAQQLIAAGGAGRTIWLVSQNGYRTLGGSCGELAASLQALLGPPTLTVPSEGGYFEHASLLAYSLANRP